MILEITGMCFGDRAPLIKSDLKTFVGHDIVYFGPTQWDGLWRNRHQLMSRFAHDNKVMYVEPVQSLRKMLTQKKITTRKLKNAIANGPVRNINKNLYIYDSAILPIIGRYPLSKITRAIWRAKFKSTLRSLGFKKTIIWISSPTMGYFLNQFDQILSIYHVVDEYSEYRGANREYMLEIEKQTLKKVDLVIVVSEKLLEAKRKIHPNVYMVKNGVDYNAYDIAIKTYNNAPEDMGTMCRPILGYSGLISYRLDLKLIKKIASDFPQGSIALLGAIDDRGCEDDIASLMKMPNVSFLGMKPIEQVPKYILAFDVCLIPYGRNGEVENLSPLKLYDSMAAGKPVVTTDFPAAHEFKDLIYIAKTDKQFIHAIAQALNESGRSYFRARRHVASRNTWENRVSQISVLIQKLIKMNN